MFILNALKRKFVVFFLVAVLFSLLPFLQSILSDSLYYGLKRELDVTAFSELRSDKAPVAVVFFGYLQCGTVCPLQFMNLKRLHDRLEGESVRFIFITLDPERDDEEKLNKAMASFGQNFIALRPDTRQEAQHLAQIFSDGAAMRPVEGGYEIDHSGFLYVVTGNKKLELIYTSPALDLDRVEQDLVRLIDNIDRKDQ